MVIHSKEGSNDCQNSNNTPCLKKQSKLFLTYLCQISTNFDNFWRKDSQDDIIMYGALIYHLT